MALYEFEGRAPAIDPSAYVAPSAQVIGDVRIGKECYVGHGAILRGDYGTIEIGDGSAVEEGAIIHARPGDATRIGKLVTLGHGCMVHNATIRDGATIGMRATVSDFSDVGEGSVIGEMALVRQHQTIPPHSIAVGVPARVVRAVSEKDRDMTHWAKDVYIDLAHRYPKGLRQIPECSFLPLPLGEGRGEGANLPLGEGRGEAEDLPPGEGRGEGADLPLPLGEGKGEGYSPARIASSKGSLTLRPIGMIRTPYREPKGTPIQGALAPDTEGEVEVFPEFAEALADLDGFSHIHLIYHFDRSAGWNPKVKPYLDDVLRGLFSTRAPSRPNPIGLTVVRLLKVEGAKLRVSGVDMLDGTPLLDIKPFAPVFDHRGDAVSGWIGERMKQSGGSAGTVADGRFHRP